MNIQRYGFDLGTGRFGHAESGVFVRFVDAQSELAYKDAQLDSAKRYAGECLNLQAAAEQRNAELVKAATAFMEYAESGWDHFPDVGVNLRSALKPTESGASE